MRALLNDVAAGRIDPGDAVEMLDDIPARDAAAATTIGDPAAGKGPLDNPPAEGGEKATVGARSGPQAKAADGADSSGGAGAASRSQTVERIRVTASTRPVRIIGDPTVATVTVEGPHKATAQGPVLLVEAGSGGPATTNAPGSYAYERKTGLSRWLAQAGIVGVPLTVRMNPTLVADVEMLAGSLEFVGLSGPVEFSLTAGSLRMRDCSGVVNGVVRVGSAVLQVRPTAGSSSIRVESGSVDLRLLEGSDVRVSGHADLGEFKVLSDNGSLRLDKTDHLPEQVLGAGTATFELAISMGSAKVRLP